LRAKTVSLLLLFFHVAKQELCVYHIRQAKKTSYLLSCYYCEHKNKEEEAEKTQATTIATTALPPIAN
jgi:hypothetical protein